MRLTILGGGGFRVPLVFGALLRATTGITEVALHDVDPDRLRVIATVLEQMSSGHESAPRVEASTDLDTALRSADFVFSAIRVGGLSGRTADERVALDLGVLGQETTGPGGIAYGLRTVPVAVRIAERIAELCPRAWVINFTNPAGMITEAMQRVLGERVLGICDSPVGLCRRAARALGLDPERTTPHYSGLNHLGWLHRLDHEGSDQLPRLLADDTALGGFEEGKLFGAEWLRSIGALPNEYLYYYYFTRDALASISGGPSTRGEFLLRQQHDFYTTFSGVDAFTEWDRVRRQRDATYMAETRTDERDSADIDEGGYEGVALAVMSAISGGPAARLPLNVRNGSAMPWLPAEAVVELDCRIDAHGPHPDPPGQLSGHQLGLLAQVKAVEQQTIDAALSGSARSAVAAFAMHPLVDSVTTARLLLEGYQARIPDIAEVFR